LEKLYIFEVLPVLCKKNKCKKIIIINKIGIIKWITKKNFKVIKETEKPPQTQ